MDPTYTSHPHDCICSRCEAMAKEDAEARRSAATCSRLDEAPDADDVKNGLLHTADDHPCCRQLIYAAHRLIDQIEGERDHYATMLCEAMQVVYATKCRGDSTDLIDRFEALELTPCFPENDLAQTRRAGD